MNEDQYGKQQLKDIEYARQIHDDQVEIVKKAEYTKDVLFNNWVQTVRRVRTKYDSAENLLKQAFDGDDTAKKWLEHDIQNTFFDGNQEFKFSGMTMNGFECNGYTINMVYEGVTFIIFIPLRSNISIHNFEDVFYGKFAFGWKESDHYFKYEFTSYDIEDASDHINSFLNRAIFFKNSVGYMIPTIPIPV